MSVKANTIVERTYRARVVGRDRPHGRDAGGDARRADHPHVQDRLHQPAHQARPAIRGRLVAPSLR